MIKLYKYDTIKPQKPIGIDVFKNLTIKSLEWRIIMKIKSIIITVTLLLLVLVLSGCGKASEKDGIVIGTEGTYRPYTYHNEKGELTGYDIEVAREVFNRLGINITFNETAWDGLLAGIDTNRFDVIANQVWRNETREKVYTLSDAYMYAGAVLVVNENNNDIKTIEDVKGKVGAHSLTSAYAEISKNAGAEVVSVNSFAEAAENVKFGRVNYTINDKDSFVQYQISNPNSGLVGYDIESIEKIDVVFVLPKEGSEKLVNDINRVLKEMSKDGTLDKLTNQFLE